MTSDQTDAAEPTPDRPEMPDFTTTVDWHAAPDTCLQLMADYARDKGALSGMVTLYMPWGIATGLVISGKEFFENAAQRARDFAATSGDEMQAKVAELYASAMFDPFAAADVNKSMDDELHQGHRTTTKIHLKNARCLMAGTQQTITHDYLRIQLGQVTAWAPGSLDI
ncbi:hypothetical protein [Nocardia rhizosphaerae]|uniref:Uncharacterized protein n=1 Tax=Nocardia rhizosphaerae TaxID=1691571 RepID=A0ABV8L1T9_9NOCA